MMQERGKRMWTRGLAVLLLAGLPACGQDLPFDYDYKSASEVEIDYNGKSYLLRQYENRTDTPFSYQFEPTGTWTSPSAMIPMRSTAPMTAPGR